MKRNNQKVEVIACKKIEPTSIEKVTRHFLPLITICEHITFIELSKLKGVLSEGVLRKLKDKGIVRITVEELNQIKINKEYGYVILRLIRNSNKR